MEEIAEWLYIKQQSRNGNYYAYNEQNQIIFILYGGDDGVIKGAVYQSEKYIGSYQHCKNHRAGNSLIKPLVNCVMVSN